MIKYLPSGENLLNIGQVDPEIIRLKEVFNEAMHADDRLKLLTKVDQIYTQCSQIIADKLFKMTIAILQFVSE